MEPDDSGKRWHFWFFRWWRHWQVDMAFRRWRWFSVGVKWRTGWPRLVAYYSPDATPSHPKKRGWA